MEVHDQSVKIDPNEHIEWAWINEEDARENSKGCNQESYAFVSEAMRRTVLEGFRLQALKDCM
jgi:hypothetical protein